MDCTEVGKRGNVERIIVHEVNWKVLWVTFAAGVFVGVLVGLLLGAITL